MQIDKLDSEPKKREIRNPVLDMPTAVNTNYIAPAATITEIFCEDSKRFLLS